MNINSDWKLHLAVCCPAILCCIRLAVSSLNTILWTWTDCNEVHEYIHNTKLEETVANNLQGTTRQLDKWLYPYLHGHHSSSLHLRVTVLYPHVAPFYHPGLCQHLPCPILTTPHSCTLLHHCPLPSLTTSLQIPWLSSAVGLPSTVTKAIISKQ